jgi:hypothetical protein
LLIFSSRSGACKEVITSFRGFLCGSAGHHYTDAQQFKFSVGADPYFIKGVPPRQAGGNPH